MILKIADCAIYYDDGTGAEYDEETIYAGLLRMKLFVIPVTTRLLANEQCRAMKEFRFARKHGILVLPILQERGLETKFNELCGDMHLLSEASGDASELAYEEKLKKY